MVERTPKSTESDEKLYQQEFTERRRDDLCTPKQAAMLAKLGVPDPQDVRFEDVDRVYRAARIANIKPPPLQGQGVHKWLIGAARVMHENGLPAVEIARRLTIATAHMKRPNKATEIAKTVRTVTNTALPVQVGSNGHAWPDPESDRLEEIVTQGDGLYGLWEGSPCRFDDHESHTEEIIDVGLPGDPLICCGLDNYKFATRRREIWRGRLSELPLIVPNPMLAVYGHTTEGKISEHTKEATAQPIYQPVEFDFAEYTDNGIETAWAPLIRKWQKDGVTVADACAALHLHLSKSLPLFLVTHSGGKSLHGWYLVQGLTKEAIRAFMEEAVRIGACYSTATKSQFVRILDGTRQNGTRQTCFYFNPQNAVKP